MSNLLEVKNLKVNFNRDKETLPIIKDISFELGENECLGILGESGSGKSMTCKAILGLLNNNFTVEGSVKFRNEDLLKLDKERIRHLRGKELCMILQNPITCFDPLYTIENQFLETLLEHFSMSKGEALSLAEECLNKMMLEKDVFKKYPHELSGGMLQRIMIALVLAVKPKVIIADEPTTAIDCINQLEVVKEFINIRKEINTSIIFITHDLSVISKVADKIIVMKDGEIVERGTVAEIIKNPQNKHTKYLVDTRVSLVKRFDAIMGK